MTHHKSLSSSAHDGPCDCQYDCSLIEPIDTTQESLTLQCGWCGGGLLHHCGELTRLVKDDMIALKILTIFFLYRLVTFLFDAWDHRK